jgi:ribosomal protein S2
MKNKIINKKNKIIKLHLLKSKIYLNNFLENKINILELIELHFKQALKIIYLYHLNYRKILFIGFPLINKKKFIKLIKNTNHYFIPESMWLNGFFSNKLFIKKNYNIHIKNLKKVNVKKNSKLKKFKYLFNINPDLVVLFQKNLNINMVKECYKLKIPIISFGNFFYSNYITYKIPGNYIYNLKQLIIIYNLLLYAIFKKSFKKSFKRVSQLLRKKKVNKTKQKLFLFQYLKYKNKARKNK